MSVVGRAKNRGRMAAALAAIKAIHGRPDIMDASKGSEEALHLEQQPSVETLPPVVERVMAGELHRQVVSAAGRTRQSRYVVLSKTSISLCRTCTSVLLYQIPLNEIISLEVQGGRGVGRSKKISPLVTKPKAFDSNESWMSATSATSSKKLVMRGTV